ncbi:MAG: hypothetical protein H7Y28_13085 [Rhodoferax sp.]|nr:hypothetical protein [Rhodoferax sp.]
MQPQAATVNDGASASFSVSVSGSAPLSYQWQKNGVAIDGAVGATYTLTAPTLSDNGAKITVTVSNSAGTASSQAVVLTVNAVPPTISTQPQSASADDGATATFSVVAAGSSPLTYQWLKNNVAIASATNASYTTADLALTDDRSQYSVIVSNAAGSITSSVAAATVRPLAPGFASPLQSVTVRDGAPVTLVSAAKGTLPLVYQWSRNGVPISGATAASYAFNAKIADSGARFSVAVTNAFGSATSAVATVNVDANAPFFIAQPISVIATTSDTATFTATASGTPPLAYQWQRSDDGGTEWTNVAGATSSNFNIAGLTLAWSNVKLRIVVSNVAASVPSQPALLTVAPRVHLVAGAAGGDGFADGQGALARFKLPNSVVSDANGNIYVGDLANYAIRKVTPSGNVSTFFKADNFLPGSLAMDGNGILYAASPSSIVRVNSNGVRTTLAGQDGVSGSNDGTGVAARFLEIRSIAVDAAGNVWVVDGSNRLVRRVTQAGVVTTVAGMQGQYGRVDGKGSSARFGDIFSIAHDASGNAYVTDGPAIRKITPDGTVSQFAGSYTEYGTADGDRLLTARFINMRGLTFDSAGNLFVAELGKIRRIEANGQTITVAGNGSSGFNNPQTDGYGSGGASFQGIAAITATTTPNYFVFADGAAIRALTPSGLVTTLAGSASVAGLADARGRDARFSSPGLIVSAPSGALYVLDRSNVTVRKVSQSGLVMTPTAFRFTTAYGVAVDTAENVYVSGTNVVYKMKPDGSVTILAGTYGISGGTDGSAQNATFNVPFGIAVDSVGNVWVSDVSDHTIRKISTSGVVSTVAGVRGICGTSNGRGSAAQFCGPSVLAFDASGNLLIGEQSGTIRRMTPDGTVSTVAGVAFSSGYGDGPVARFNGISGLVADANGNIFVADSANNVIRKITPSGVTSTVMGVYGAKVLTLGLGGSINTPGGVALTPAGRLFVTSENAVVGD